MIKRILVIGLVLAAGAGVGAIAAWQQATHLPGWYTQTEGTATDPDIAILTAEQLQQPEEVQQIRLNFNRTVENAFNQGESASNQPPQVRLNAQEFNQLLVAALPESAASEEVYSAIKGIETQIKQDRLKSGAVVNMGELPLEQLPERYQQMAKGVFSTFPALKNREVYVGIEGQPRLENGRLVLDDQTRIKVGNISLSQQEVSRRLGLSPAELNRLLTLNVGNLQVQDLEFSGNTAILKGTTP
ncbi:hypothetical protein GS597_02505 [Synechococcales cyanobacterium C]|uniref:Uncharacterized protein n=1 Tax=Petrachloros mirabilis ULC683 TaxID=2781853 RepID=A0A8K1ZWY2_9CYAN|nr:hypothetical protein [Petrachloros mirabilis]NCJ05402.1 hypothetical protein [Petrachloros mirabilis ULC683]